MIFIVQLFLFAAAGAVMLMLPLFGHEPKGNKTIAITGEVVGLACYLGHNSHGKSHTECAVQCAKSGVPLAILTNDSKTLYLPLSGHQGANKKLLQYAEKTVRVTGKLINKNAMKAITIENIEVVESE